MQQLTQCIICTLKSHAHLPYHSLFLCYLCQTCTRQKVVEATVQLAVWIDSFSSCRDLSEQIKKVTKESHVRAENTELMLSFQRGQVTLQQYKVIQSSRTCLKSIFIIIISLCSYLFWMLLWHHLSSSSSSSAPPVLTVWDLPGLGGRAGQELQPPWSCTHLLPDWTGQAGGHWERPGILQWRGLEGEDRCPRSH